MKGALFAILFLLKTTTASDQYRTSLISVKKCENPELPYSENAPFNVFLETYNSSTGTTLIRGYVLVNNNIREGTQKGGLSYGYQTLKGINWVYKLRDLDCGSFVTKALLNSLGVPFTKKCMIKKGKYGINEVDVDKIDHALQGSMARKYGVWVAVITYYNKTEMLTCWEARLNVQAIKKHA